MWSRRRFIAGTAALAAHPLEAAQRSSTSAKSHESERSSYTAKDYERAIVIDALGAVGDPEPGATIETEPSPRLLKDLRDSGLTAISVTLSVGSTGDRLAKAIRRIATLNEKIAAAPDVLMRIRHADDLRTAKATRRLGVIYNVQDTSLLENDLSRVTTLRALGLRVMQMTYNTRNLVGDGCLERADSGLSNLGRELVGELHRSRVVMDLSHSGRATIAEAIREAKVPPTISHTGCRDLHDHPRNVYDSELRALADKGGVAGIYFMPFLVPRGSATKDDLIRHIEHAVNVCGEDHVGLGTDGNVSATVIDDEYRAYLRQEYESRVAQGIAAPGESPDVHQFILEYNHPRRFFSLADELSVRGWTARRIDKLLGGNFARVYGEVWG
jgi:membrane dipeptidase